MAEEPAFELAYDDDAAVWYVASSDIPGLLLEAATREELVARIKDAAPELVELNGFRSKGGQNALLPPARPLT